MTGTCIIVVYFSLNFEEARINDNSIKTHWEGRCHWLHQSQSLYLRYRLFTLWERARHWLQSLYLYYRWHFLLHRRHYWNRNSITIYCPLNLRVHKTYTSPTRESDFEQGVRILEYQDFCHQVAFIICFKKTFMNPIFVKMLSWALFLTEIYCTFHCQDAKLLKYNYK